MAIGPQNEVHINRDHEYAYFEINSEKYPIDSSDPDLADYSIIWTLPELEICLNGQPLEKQTEAWTKREQIAALTQKIYAHIAALRAEAKDALARTWKNLRWLLEMVSMIAQKSPRKWPINC